MKSGVYRIDVPPNDNQTWVTVRKGSGQATGQGPAVKVSSGEQVRFTGQGSLNTPPMPLLLPTASKIGRKSATSASKVRYLLATSLPESSATRTSTTTESGK